MHVPEAIIESLSDHKVHAAVSNSAGVLMSCIHNTVSSDWSPAIGNLLLATLITHTVSIVI